MDLLIRLIVKGGSLYQGYLTWADCLTLPAKGYRGFPSPLGKVQSAVISVPTCSPAKARVNSPGFKPLMTWRDRT